MQCSSSPTGFGKVCPQRVTVREGGSGRVSCRETPGSVSGMAATGSSCLPDSTGNLWGGTTGGSAHLPNSPRSLCRQSEIAPAAGWSLLGPHHRCSTAWVGVGRSAGKPLLLGISEHKVSSSDPGNVMVSLTTAPNAHMPASVQCSSTAASGKQWQRAEAWEAPEG